MYLMKNNFKNKGFTLIEVMVSLALFIAVMTIAAGALLSIIDANRKSQAEKSVIDNVNFALDNMVRNIRTGTEWVCGNIDPGRGSWQSTGDKNCGSGGTALMFKSQKGPKVIYGFVNSTKTISVSKELNYDPSNPPLPGRPVAFSGWEPLTGAQVEVDGLTFRVTGAEIGSADNQQPSVIISVKAHGGYGGKAKYRSDLIISTSVTQRQLDR